MRSDPPCVSLRAFVGAGDPSPPTCALYSLQEGVSLRGHLPLGLHLCPPLQPGLAPVRSGAIHHPLTFQGEAKAWASFQFFMLLTVFNDHASDPYNHSRKLENKQKRRKWDCPLWQSGTSCRFWQSQRVRFDLECLGQPTRHTPGETTVTREEPTPGPASGGPTLSALSTSHDVLHICLAHHTGWQGPGWAPACGGGIPGLAPGGPGRVNRVGSPDILPSHPPPTPPPVCQLRPLPANPSLLGM